MKRLMIPVVLCFMGLPLACRSTYPPSAPPASPTPTPTSTPAVALTPTLPNTSTGTATSTSTMTQPPTASKTPTNSPTNSASPTPTSTSTATNLVTLTATVTGTPTNSATSSPTSSPTITPTSTFTNTLTPTASPFTTQTSTPTSTASSGCVTLGLNDPSPVITITINPNGYLANAIPISSCGSNFNQIQVYVGNPGAAPLTFDVAVYDNLNEVSAVTLVDPGMTWGWLSASTAPFALTCGDKAVVAVHNQGTTWLFLGASSAGQNCIGDAGAQSGSMPSTYPNSGILTAPSISFCYEVNVESCGSSAPTDTNTPTQTPTSTATSSPTPSPTASWTASPTVTCNTMNVMGDSTPGVGGPVTVFGGNTSCQKYSLAQTTIVRQINFDVATGWSLGALVSVGIYSDGGVFPDNLLWSSATQTAVDGINSVYVPQIVLPAGNYWLAISTNQEIAFVQASGSTSTRTWEPVVFQNPYISPGGPSPTPMPTPPPTSTTQIATIWANICY